MDNIIARYEDYLIHTKHASANTVSSYMRDIRQYASYLSGIDVDVLEADQSVVSAYMQWLQSIGKSPATVSRCLASLKSLYLFALSEDEIEQNPVHNIKVEMAEKMLPQMPEEQVKNVNLFVLKLFFLKPYEAGDFYSQFQERMTMARDVLEL